MFLGDATLTPVVRRFFLMPMFVMASKLCPDGSEATLFSVMMSLSNFGYDVGTYFGAMLLTVFHVSNGNTSYTRPNICRQLVLYPLKHLLAFFSLDDYSNFAYCIGLKSAMRILPIFLVPFLVPLGSPQDKPPPEVGTASSESEEHHQSSPS